MIIMISFEEKYKCAAYEHGALDTLYIPRDRETERREEKNAEKQPKWSTNQIENIMHMLWYENWCNMHTRYAICSRIIC